MLFIISLSYKITRGSRCVFIQKKKKKKKKNLPIQNAVDFFWNLNFSNKIKSYRIDFKKWDKRIFFFAKMGVFCRYAKHAKYDEKVL